LSLGGSAKPTPAAGSGNKTIKDLEKEKANANIWGQGRAGGQPGAFGNFGGGFGASSTPNTNASSGGDDLLL
jgi:epsin